MKKNLVLVGAGHAHLDLVRTAGAFGARGLSVVLVDRGDFWYSGMATGMLSGQYRPSEGRIDPGELARRCGAQYVCDEVVGVDRIEARALLGSGKELEYDLLSLNVGSEIRPLQVPDDGSVAVYPAKPIPGLDDLRRRLVDAAAEGGVMPAAAVIGGGATGVEVAANLLGLAENLGIEPNVALIDPAPLLVPHLPGRASAALTSLLRRRGLRHFAGQRVVALDTQEIVTERSRIPCQVAVVATGLRAGGLVQRIGLSASEEGLAINACLQSVEDPRVFAVGDCADFSPRSLPSLGVFGVRAAPVLRHNLIAMATGVPCREFRPQRVWLSILNLGDGQGLLSWGPVWWRGRASMWLKDRLDRRFMAKYKTPIST